jgi:hypothetical protein
LGHDRIRYLDDVVFEHMHYILGKGAADSTYNKKNQRADDLLFIALDDERLIGAKLLAQYIEAQREIYPIEHAVQHASLKGLRLGQETGLIGLLKRIFCL